MTTPLHDPTAGPVPDALRVAGLTVSLPAVDRPYDGAKPILRGLSFRAPTGQVTVIVGSNGAGKTTALRAIAGAFPSDAGAVHVLGTAMGRAERALPPEAALVSDTPPCPVAGPRVGWPRSIGRRFPCSTCATSTDGCERTASPRTPPSVTSAAARPRSSSSQRH